MYTAGVMSGISMLVILFGELFILLVNAHRPPSSHLPTSFLVSLVRLRQAQAWMQRLKWKVPKVSSNRTLYPPTSHDGMHSAPSRHRYHRSVWVLWMPEIQALDILGPSFQSQIPVLHRKKGAIGRKAPRCNQGITYIVPYGWYYE